MRRPTEERGAPGVVQLVVLITLVLAVTFNALLAFVNANLSPVPANAVVAAEIVIVAVALILALFWSPQDALPWYLLMAGVLVVFLVRSLVTGEVAPKYARDVLLIPTFVVLGMIASDRTLDRTVLVVLVLVMAVAALEVLAPDTYTATFKIQDYYHQTRGTQIEGLTNSESELFISAIRPDSRIFAFLDLPRVSSLFLEPVSLANYCSVMTAYLCARHRRIGMFRTLFLGACVIALLLGSDGRLATATSLVMITVTLFIAARLPPYASVLYLPVAIALAFALVAANGPQPSSDDLLGRLASTVELLRRFDLADWMGISNVYLVQAVDSGIAYLTATQSIIGVIALWLFLVLASKEGGLAQLRYKHAALLYVSLTMLVSYSLFTIKTAALLWFIHGVLQSQRAPGRIAAVPQPPTQDIAHARFRQA